MDISAGNEREPESGATQGGPSGPARPNFVPDDRPLAQREAERAAQEAAARRRSEPESAGSVRQHPFDVAFGPPEGLPWRRPVPELVTYRRVVLLVIAAVAGLAAGAGAVLLTGSWPLGAVPPLLAVAACAYGWFAVRRDYLTWGFAEGEGDLYITHGLYVRQLVAIPYGRVQFVDVITNPLEQAMGLATVRLFTAAATTDAGIPGLPLDEAVLLRDRLTARSETFSTGL
ncbi:PH domain-containing protein [Allonocardiopsis opalescens]|uniref:YdbS-like PH domain-containing protein n=1 Tax=Allonocardiopsis opalescens TaxID=1144618 RepID=A0A2T0Q2A5_9ACTN|nr:PH domain-containing protein [Allonocardiopsis opalescens]PRX97840.1 hypothetical protein CLV72_105190 [Allonocardiopsis opalescens]